MNETKYFTSLLAANNFIFSNLEKNIHCATPLGLGKPNQLLNLIYQTVKNDSSLKLKISTALSLEIPRAKSELEKNFSEPYLDQHFGENYPELDYVLDSKKNKIPENISIHEFYMQAARNINIESSQRNYTSLNYTHVAQNLFDTNIDIIVQLVATKQINGKDFYSLSCNPDLTLDLVDLFKKEKKKLMVVAVVHPDLPYIGGDAEVPSHFFNAVVNSTEINHQLFSLPQYPLDTTDFVIGLYASQFLQDDGTIQIGIGSLSDAIVHATLIRQNDNQLYKSMLEKMWSDRKKPDVRLSDSIFEKGLYGTSEMVTDAFMHLRKAGILTRDIFDVDEKLKRYLHGAFFLGTKKFYSWLRNLSDADHAGFSMTRVSKVNDLYDPHELALRRQRRKACFFNTCMMVDLLGGASSDTLSNGQVISGVGGQFNFVGMSHELPDSYSILMLRSTYSSKGKRTSSIVWNSSFLTIPRHMRDVVVTEYGIANLRGKTDEEVICALIEIADSEFQNELVAQAKKHRKIRNSYEVPLWAKNNTPENLNAYLKLFPDHVFPAFPFGSDFSDVEQKLVLALTKLKEAKPKPLRLMAMLIKGLMANKALLEPELTRMKLYKPRSLSGWVYKNLLAGAFVSS